MGMHSVSLFKRETYKRAAIPLSICLFQKDEDEIASKIFLVFFVITLGRDNGL